MSSRKDDSTNTGLDLLSTAFAFYEFAGLNVLPIPGHNKPEMREKRPRIPWKNYKTERVTEKEFSEFFPEKLPAGLAIITGYSVAGSPVELFEFETLAIKDEFKKLAEERGLGDLLRRVVAGYCERSPRGGYHLLWRCAEVGPNTKLAGLPAPAPGQAEPVLIETRGVGGLAVVAPSSGRVHPNGKPWKLLSGGPTTIAEIAPEEREALFSVAQSLDRRPPPTPWYPTGRDAGIPDDDRPDTSHPGVAWSLTDETTIGEMLEAEGWTLDHTEEEVEHWTRPGKEGGTSAVVGRARDVFGNPALYVFTTSTPFEASRSYDKFGVYTVLKYGGDFKAASAALRAEGHGGEVGGEDGPITEREIVLAARKILIQRKGKQRADEEEAGAIEYPESRLSLKDELAIEEEDEEYTIEALLPIGGNVLLAAKYKAGKTTLNMNLLRSAADGDDFLEAFEVRPIEGRTAYWNYELSERQCRQWLRELGIRELDKASVLHLRGYRLPLESQAAEDWAVEWLSSRGVELWILDPFARAFSGEENSNSEVGRFLESLDVVKQRAGVRDLVLTTHMGRAEFEEGQERARGATRLDDWADVRWTLTEQEGVRFFQAHGRDVDTGPARELTVEGRRLRIGERSRADTRLERLVVKVRNAVRARPGIGKSDLIKAVGKAADASDAITEAIRRGIIRMEQKGNSHKHFLVEEG